MLSLSADHGSTFHLTIGLSRYKYKTEFPADRDNFVSRMGQIASEADTVIYAWALMTNHAHILLRSGLCGLSKFMDVA